MRTRGKEMVYDACGGMGRSVGRKDAQVSYSHHIRLSDVVLVVVLSCDCTVIVFGARSPKLELGCTCWPWTIAWNGAQDCLFSLITTDIRDQSTMSKENIVGERRSHLCPLCFTEHEKLLTC